MMYNWQEIAEQHGPLVWSVAYRVLQNHEDAADCHQEVFVDAMRRTVNETIDDWAAFLRWLTVQRAIDLLRSKKRRRQNLCINQQVDQLPSEFIADNRIEWNELIEIIRRELISIPAKQAQVVWLHCIEEVDLSEIAEQLRVTDNHARVLLSRGRTRLREALRCSHPAFIERPNS